MLMCVDIFVQVASAVGSHATEDEQFAKLHETKATIEQVARLFKDEVCKISQLFDFIVY